LGGAFHIERAIAKVAGWQGYKEIGLVLLMRRKYGRLGRSWVGAKSSWLKLLE
jgi:hypothetical protein